MSETERLAAPLSFCGISVDARSSVSFSSGPDLCQDLKGCLKGPSISKRGKLGFGGGVHMPITPGKKVD